jgi:hypothetical protein
MLRTLLRRRALGRHVCSGFNVPVAHNDQAPPASHPFVTKL